MSRRLRPEGPEGVWFELNLAGDGVLNRLVLQASLAERGALRYTPAGLPALDLQLQHESEVSHEGQARKVTLELRAVVIGSLVSKVAPLSLGSPLTASGFLAPARNGKGILFHITDLVL